MYGLVSYLAGPGRANEHTNQRVVAASSSEIFYAGGSGSEIKAEKVGDLVDVLDEARVVFGTEVTRRDNKKLAAARERGASAQGAIAEATSDENVWHCSLSLPPEAAALDDAQWSLIAHEFMTEMGFDDPNHAAARWVAIHHGETKNGGDHIHIAASRVRDDGSVVNLWQPHPSKPGRKEGDYPRAQRVCRAIEEKHGLEVLSGRSQDMPARGVHHAQDARAVKENTEAPIVALGRRVRSAAVAAESEAEFVRLVRTDGLVIRPAHYDANDPEAVTGYSVGLPADEVANRHGRPIMHGGKKLGEDLSLPRLRERWIDDDRARADARSAWLHAADKSSPAVVDSMQESKPTAAAPAHRIANDDLAAIDTRLRTVLLPIARSAPAEADYVRAVRAHPDVLIRPRYAKGSTTNVTGYAVALRPSLAATADGGPHWRSAGYLAPELKLSELRTRWPSGPQHDKLAEGAWRRAASTEHKTTNGVPSAARDAAAAADRWQSRVSTVADRQSRAWHGAAADTAAAVGAASRHMTGADQARLNDLANALGRVGGHRRTTRPAGSSSRSAVARVAATMIAATNDDTTLLWLAVARQLLATSRAIGEAMQAQGHTRQAQQIAAATTAVQNQFSGRTAPVTPPRPRSPERATSAPTITAPRPPMHHARPQDGPER
ncbi:relaxase/mobilization nuclease domain-containing protein [Gordonia sp. (in: high G+C Gram-positive bacteria)]|uniref:relaxase/mobilization nuclease domain-containing protein n=1 Tax=Gordonia sp. (in: high G+C Gram-positive bacteria) TaxID=84139 RepID=UPI003C764DA6